METTGKYVLDVNGKVVPEPDLMKWAKWYEKADRKVAAAFIGDTRVSTVFLAMDHQYGSGEPLLWETLVFGGPLNDEMDRYSTREEAIKGHGVMCRRVKAALNEGEATGS